MFAFFGLGLQEIIILAILGALLIGVPMLIFLVVRSANKSGHSELLAENERLRDELNRTRDKS